MAGNAEISEEHVYFCRLGSLWIFSKLKLVKSYLRSTTGQKRLSSLGIVSLERDVLNKLDPSAIVSKFAPNRRLMLEL